MIASDSFSERYQDLLDGSYDCVDRIVFNGYCPWLCSAGGFRSWWRQVHAMARQRNIPLLEKVAGERMQQAVEQHRPTDETQKGLFCITIHRAPNSVWGVKTTANGSPHLARKNPPVWVNHFAFHFQDPDWGHVTFKICPHPPFSVQVILNGHEYVARQAQRLSIPFTKEGNCFTATTQLAELDQVAETLRSSSAEGPLREVCERWFFSAVLCYLLRIEAIVHNAKKEFARGYGLDRFTEIVEALRSLVERFLEVLRSVEACWVSDETWESLSEKDQGYPPLSGSGRWAADHHGGRRASGEDP